MGDIHYKTSHGQNPLELAAGSHTLRDKLPWMQTYTHTCSQRDRRRRNKICGHKTTNIFTQRDLIETVLCRWQALRELQPDAGNKSRWQKRQTVHDSAEMRWSCWWQGGTFGGTWWKISDSFASVFWQCEWMWPQQARVMFFICVHRLMQITAA